MKRSDIGEGSPEKRQHTDNEDDDDLTNNIGEDITDASNLLDQETFSHSIQADDVIAQHMDITSPLTVLRSLLEERLGVGLQDYTFWLQDTQQLEADKNLVDQCVQGEGLVQINVEITAHNNSKRINIVDVLKPAEELVEMTEDLVHTETEAADSSRVESENVTRWVVSADFRRDQERLKIPHDPCVWSKTQVLHWLNWAIQQFNLERINLDDWNMVGKELCALTHSEFAKRVPVDKGDLFWTHLELLRKCKFVAVVQQPVTISLPVGIKIGRAIALKGSHIRPPKIGLPRIADGPQPGNRTGNNGQIQLWQFLLELLTDKDRRDIIQWIGTEGEFKLSNPELVAQMWGHRKNKPNMNYEKLSRALRYYYDGDMIAKVHGKRFVYKFVCDLKTVLGYSAEELNRLVMESEQKLIMASRNMLPG